MLPFVINPAQEFVAKHEEELKQREVKTIMELDQKMMDQQVSHVCLQIIIK